MSHGMIGSVNITASYFPCAILRIRFLAVFKFNSISSIEIMSNLRLILTAPSNHKV